MGVPIEPQPCGPHSQRGNNLPNQMNPNCHLSDGEVKPGEAVVPSKSYSHRTARGTWSLVIPLVWHWFCQPTSALFHPILGLILPWLGLSWSWGWWLVQANGGSLTWWGRFRPWSQADLSSLPGPSPPGCVTSGKLLYLSELQSPPL